MILFCESVVGPEGGRLCVALRRAGRSQRLTWQLSLPWAFVALGFVALTFFGLLAGFFAGFAAFLGVLAFFAAGFLAFFGLLVTFFGDFLAAFFGDFLTAFFGVLGFLAALGLVTFVGFSTLPNLKDPAAPVPFVWTSLPATTADLR